MFDRLLKQSILTLCKEAIAFDDDLLIDGIICLTSDGGPQQVIQVHELFLKIGNKSPNATMPASGASSVEIHQSTQKPNVQCVNNASLEVSNIASTSRESDRISDADVNAAATADTNNNRTNAEVNAAATADTNNNRTNAEVNAAATADTHNNCSNAEVNADTNNNRTNAEVNASTSDTQAGETGTIGVQETDIIVHRSTEFVKSTLQVKKEYISPTEKLDEKFSASDFKTPTSGLGMRKGNTSERIREHMPLSGVLNKLKNKIKLPATERKLVYDEPTQLDAGSVYDEHTQNDDYTDNSPGTFNLCVYDKVTQNDSDSPANNDRRWQLYHKPPLRHNVDNNTRNNGTGNKTPYNGPATEAGTANTSNPELRTLITKPALNNNNCASKIGKDNAKESGTPRVTGTTAAAASMGDQTRRKTSTGRANTPIMKQKDWKIPDLSEISAERQKTTDINSNVAYANAAADGETAAKRPKLMTEVKIEVDQLDDASNESIETDSPTQYSKTSVLGMETDFSSADNLSSAYTNTKVRPPQGFKKVLTPDKRFKSKGSFTCNLCDAKFTDFDNLNVHCDLVHHTYFCKYCGKSFKSKSNRERHAGYHTGTRPYTCDECGVSFSRVGDLKHHTTSKHAPKLYACGVCNEAFAYRKQLEKHFTAYPEHMRQ